MAAINSGPPTAEAYAEAWRLIAEARRLKPIDPRFPLLLGRLETIAGNRLFHDRGAPGRAVALYREAIALSPHDPRPRLELGHYLIETDDLPGALAEARAALEVEPHFVRARILEASVLARLGRGAEAAAARAALEATLGVVRGFNPGSGYGREIVQDAPESRARLDDLLRGAPAPG
jgi:Flp pilus assembly protein TadD